MADELKEVLDTAMDVTNDSLKVVNKGLYRGVSTRPTEHVIEFTEEINPEFRGLVMDKLESSPHEIREESENQIRIVVDGEN